MSTIPLFVGLLFTGLCGTIILTDLRLMRIPDWITLSVVALFTAWMAFDYGAVAIMPRLIVAGIVFCICFGLFAARIMGGGDTKVIPALALFAPPEHLPSIMLAFGASLLLSIALIVAARKWLSVAQSQWVALTSQKLPMGVAIGATGIVVWALGQFSV